MALLLSNNNSKLNCECDMIGLRVAMAALIGGIMSHSTPPDYCCDCVLIVALLVTRVSVFTLIYVTSHKINF